MDKLTVVNQCLATLGEQKLTSLTDSHAFLDNAHDCLEDQVRVVASHRWWFNEEKLSITPNAVDKGLYLPGNTLEVICPKPQYVQRGNRIYNTDGGSYEFDDVMKVTIYRLLDFEELPETVAQYIAAKAVLKFQTDFDGDQLKSQRLEQKVVETMAAAQAQETRNRKVNMIANNESIMRIKRYH
jgi:hypothetical protein